MSRGPINGWLFSLSLRRRLVRLCRALEPRFLWSSFAFPDGVGVGRIARQLGIPHVVSIVGSDLNANLGRPGRMAAIEGTLREARVVLAKSRALRESLLERGVPGERVFVDYNGVDARVFHPVPRAGACVELGVPAGAKRVLFVGSLVPVKNVPVLVGAFDRLRRQMSEPVELAIVGGGFLASSVRRELDRRGLGGTVRMVGPRAPAEVAAWLGASDVLCLPSRSEGVPNVVLEALACGRPVVASAVGGIPEVHPGAEAGDLVRPGDEEALAQALRSALSREWQPAELSRLVKDFTWEANARRVVGWFEAAGLVGEDLAP
jgi:glycosyltransferase involved in cell wall biosynthesis